MKRKVLIFIKYFFIVFITGLVLRILERLILGKIEGFSDAIFFPLLVLYAFKLNQDYKKSKTE